MGRITDLLNVIDVTKENTEELYEIFRIIEDYSLPVIRFYLYAGSGLIRQRVNEKGTTFNTISELNYPPAYCITKYERANLPFQPMFYACSFPGDYDDEKNPPPRVISLQETSSFFKDTKSSGIERCTVSRWEVVQDIELIAMPFLADYKMPCAVIQQIKEAWNQGLRDNNVNADGRELIEYMANEIGKDFKTNVEYFKIANFVNYVLNVNEKTKNADGVIYPSVPAGGAGFNVAVRPPAVDEKIKFVGASLCHLLKREDKSYLCVMNDTESINNGIITYKDKVIEDAEKNVYQAYANGLSFIN